MSSSYPLTIIPMKLKVFYKLLVSSAGTWSQNLGLWAQTDNLDYLYLFLSCSVVRKGKLCLLGIWIRKGASEAFQQTQAARCTSPTYLRNTSSLVLISTLSLLLPHALQTPNLGFMYWESKKTERQELSLWLSTDGQFQSLAILNL